MNSTITHKMPQIEAVLRQHYVSRAYLFGSVCTDRFNNDSDVDVLISFDDGLDPVAYGDAYFALASALESLLERPVDLLTERSLKNPYFIRQLNLTKTLIYE